MSRDDCVENNCVMRCVTGRRCGVNIVEESGTVTIDMCDSGTG